MSKSKFAKTFAAALVAVTVALGTNFVPSESSQAASRVTARLLWHLEFAGRAGTKPSTAVFNYDIGGDGWGNGEHEAYTENNAKYSGRGALNITANRVQYNVDGGDVYPTCPIDTPGGACEFESSRINTQGKLNFKYGRLVASIKNPAGFGTWPAFWLLGSDIDSNVWPNCGEIDIMESKGATPFTTYGTAHGPGYSGGDGIVNAKSLSKNLSAGYHTYQIDWLPNSIKWYVDGKLYHTVNPSIVGDHPWVFNKPMFLILNLAMGGWFTGDIDPDLQSAQMSIDYIRFYSLNGVGSISGTSAAKRAGRP